MKILTSMVTCSLLCVSSFYSVANNNITPEASHSEPVRLSYSLLQKSKNRAQSGDSKTLQAIAVLDKAAHALLSSPSFTIVNKRILPVSGNKHDYFSFGPYWWPDPNKTDGKPWIKIDGKINPASRQPEQDKIAFMNFSAAVQTLSEAYYFTDNPQYASKAATLIKAWFLDEATKMNPHLNYAQSIPGITDGRGIGIIDMWYLYRVVDGIRLIQTSDALTKQDNEQLQLWFTQYLQWLVTSPLGIEERNTHNNHATFYALQTAMVALFVGQKDIATLQVQHAATLLDKQIDTKGMQPHELKRTRPFHYSTFNLHAFVGLAAAAPKVGLDLWQHPTSEQPKLQAAINYIFQRSNQESDWGGNQEHKIDKSSLLPLLPELINAYNLPASQYLTVQQENAAMVAQCALLFGVAQPDISVPAEFIACPY